MENQQKNKENEIKKIRKIVCIVLLGMIIFFSSLIPMRIHATDVPATYFSLFFIGTICFLLGLFSSDIVNKSKKEIIARFEFVENSHRRHVDVKLPEKATEHSVGYDFFSPEKRALAPGEQHMFWTDVKVHLKQDEALLISPRSSIGIIKNLMLANTIGTIDPDYYGNEENDGNIGICLYNYGTERALMEKGGRIAQGTVITVVHDKIPGNLNKRKGGFGSTGK